MSFRVQRAEHPSAQSQDQLQRWIWLPGALCELFFASLAKGLAQTWMLILPCPHASRGTLSPLAVLVCVLDECSDGRVFQQLSGTSGAQLKVEEKL